MADKYSMLAKFGADTTGLKQGFNRAKRDADQFSNHLKKVGGLMAGAFSVGAIIDFGKKAVELANIQAQAETKLLTSLKGNEAAYKRLTKAASEMQSKTLYGDEVIINQQAFLASLGMGEDKINAVIAAAMDLSTVTGMSLESAVKNISKTFSGLSGELGELIPEMKGLTAEQLKAGEGLDLINDKMGGQAAAAAATGTGAVQQLSNAWGDFAEVIGKQLIPTLNQASSATTNFLQGMTGFMQAENLSTGKKWWTVLKSLITPGSGGLMEFGKAMAEDTMKGFQNANMEVPQWYSDMQAEMARQAELKSAELKAIYERNLGTKKVSGLQAKQFSGTIATQGLTAGKATGYGTDSGLQLGQYSDNFANFMGNDYDEAANKVADINKMLQDSFTNMASSIAGSLAEGIGAVISGTASMGDMLKGLLSTFLDFVTHIGKAMIQLGIGMFTLKKTLFKTPMAAIAAGVAVVALAAALKGAISKGPEAPALAQGGLAYGPTAAIVGDNPRANVDPEVIAPLSKLQNIIGGNQGGQVEFIISGDKLKGVLNRYDRRLNTIT